jgi:surface protein
MEKMFEDAYAFNGDISKWDVSEVTNMNKMFSGASAFNSDISEWDVSKCTDARSLSSMFRYASSFDQNLSSWNVPCEPYPRYHLYRSFMGTKMTESMAPSVPCPTLTSASASGLGASSSAFPRVARASPVAVCAAAFIAAVAVVVATRAALRARRYPTPTGFPVHVGEETALLLPRRDRDAVTTAPMFWRGRV